MSKWRPSDLDCLYVIPDIHGNFNQLKLICNRILPLRKSDGIKDKLVFLGDYIDRGEDTPAVLDFLIDIKKKYKDQVIFLRGNHEDMLLGALGKKDEPSSEEVSNYSMWVQNGGAAAIGQYLEQYWKSDLNPFTLPKSRLPDLIPLKHVKFLESTQYYYEYEQYIFVHAGCNPNVPLEQQDEEFLIWDRSVFKFVLRQLKNKQELLWDKTIITGHNYTGPIVNEKFMMLDCSLKQELIVVELNSMEACIAKYGNKRLIKKLLSETIV